MVDAAGPAAEMTVPRMAILAIAVIGMFWAVMLLVLGMSRRGTRTVPGHRVRARTKHNRPGLRPTGAPVSLRPSAQRPAAPLNLRPPAQRPPAAPVSLRRPDRASQDPSSRAGSSGYRPPSLWGDEPDDPRRW